MSVLGCWTCVRKRLVGDCARAAGSFLERRASRSAVLRGDSLGGLPQKTTTFVPFSLYFFFFFLFLAEWGGATFQWA